MPLPVLTASERLEAAQHVFLILDRVEKGKLKNRKFGPEYFFHRRETALSVNLKVNWRKTYTEALKEIFKVIPESITREAMDLLERELLSVLGPAFGISSAVRREMRKKIEEAYSAAKRGWSLETPKDKKSPLLSLPDRRAIETLTRHNCFWLGEHYGEHIGPKISDLTRQALEDGLGRKALAEQLKERLGGVAPEDYQYWDVASSAALVRARSFGTIAGMEDAGVTEYEVLAMGDERMCPICREMHGRVFSVADARAVIDSVLEVDDPVKFKDAMPWMTAPAVERSSSEISRSGQSMPPFHGRCRCTLIVRSRTATRVTRESFTTLTDKQEVKHFDPDTRIAQVRARSLPVKGLPNWKYDKIGKSGAILERRFYDDEGEVVTDVHMTNHGNPHNHENPHVHEWKGKEHKSRIMRSTRKWEKEMSDAIRKTIIKDGEEAFTLLSDINDTGRYAAVEEFVEDMQDGFCGEVMFKWRGHGYTIWRTNDQKFAIGEWHNDKSDREFKSADELLDGYVLVSGEKLRDVITQVEVESVA